MYSRTCIITFFVIILLLTETNTQGFNFLKNAKPYFENMFQNTARKLAFINAYESEITRRSLSLEQFNLSSEVINYAGRIGHIIKSLENSLKMLVSWTEEEISKYSWNPKLQSNSIKYNDLRELKPNDSRLTAQPGYQFNVMLNKSGVHLPVEVYRGDPSVFHTLRWTEVLDAIFPTEPKLHFTYFASLTGILRVYPAFPWREQTVDMFDVRRRSWFIQGSSVPRDLFILLDTSGSMTGQSLKLANLSAQKLIESLDVDDYFVVAHFPGAKDHSLPMIVTANNESEPICFSSFVQATKRNKLRLFYDLSTLKARGHSNFSTPLEFAYEMFRNLAGSARGDRGRELRNKILVMMTDNAFVFDEYVMSQLKQQKSNITTFIYSLGEPVGAANEHSKKACATNDYYQYLPTVGAVSNLMKDFHDKSTQIRFGPNNSPLPTGVILHGASDVLHTDQYKGTGLMVSISMPVYNRTKRLEFLGLMGTELPISLMMQGLPQTKLYPVGYAFVVNTNGYLVFHPSLVPEYTWLDDTPFLDFLDVELNVYGSKTVIRKKLIDNERGSEQIIDFIKVSDNIHTYVKPRLYSFTKLLSTDFGVAFVVPTDQHLFLNIPKEVEFSVSSDSSGNYMIDNVLIQNLIKKAKVILPWKAIDGYIKAGCHFFNLESAEEHDKLHKNEDEQEWILAESKRLQELEEEEQQRKKDAEELESFEENISTEYVEEGNNTQINSSLIQTNDESTSTTEELISNNTLCLDDTNSINCSTDKPLFSKKLFKRSGSFMSSDDDSLPLNDAIITTTSDDAITTTTKATTTISTTTQTTNVENFNELPFLPSEQTFESTVVVTSESATLPEDSPEVDDFQLRNTPLDTIAITSSSFGSTTVPSTSPPNDFQPVVEVTVPEDRESPSTVSTLTTSTANFITEPESQKSTDEQIVNNNPEIEQSVVEQIQRDDLKNFLDQIKNINSTQSELLSQILLEIIIAEKDVTTTAESIQLDGIMRSRTIALNTGLLWTIPVTAREDFYDELKYWPNSPIFQRVYDSKGLIFWIPLRKEENTIKSADIQTKSTDSHDSSMENDATKVTESSASYTTVNDTQQSESVLHRVKRQVERTPENNQEEEQESKTSEEIVLNNTDDQKLSNVDTFHTETFAEVTDPTDEAETILEDDEAAGEPIISDDKEDEDLVDNTPLPATIFTPLTITQGQYVYKAGVMGITFEPEYLSKQLAMVSECSGPNSNKLCYLLEDAANIVAVNNNSFYHQIGKFLGHVDPELMGSLIQNHVYGVLKDYDFEGTCYPREDKSESTSPAMHPIPSILMNTRNIFSIRIWFDWLLTFSSLSLFITRSLITGMITTIVSGDMKDDVDPQNKPYPCIQLINRYYSMNSQIYDTRDSPLNMDSTHIFRGFIHCSLERNRDWSAQSISGTNLHLIITDPIFDECDTSVARLQRDPIKDSGPDVCGASRSPRYRRQSQKWTLVPNDDEVEMPTHCSEANSLHKPPLIIYSFISLFTLCYHIY
ncbi:unnamed protein product [Trichobilharzia szidati]|nr:unnamed protein product [Trichobilharzia szidati]